jgi:hypothetical protein
MSNKKPRLVDVENSGEHFFGGAGGASFALPPFLDARSSMRLLQALAAPVPVDANKGTAGFGMPTFTDMLTQRVVTARVEYNKSILLAAVQSGTLDDVIWLLARNALSYATKDRPDDFGLLEAATYYVESSEVRSAIVCALCDAGVDPKGDDNEPLCTAIQWERVDVVRELLTRGARISAWDAIDNGLNLWNQYLVVEGSSLPADGGGGGVRAAASVRLDVGVYGLEIYVSVRGGPTIYFSHEYVEGNNASLDAALDKALDFVVGYITPRVERHFRLVEAGLDDVPFGELRKAMVAYLRVGENQRNIMRLVLDHPPPDDDDEEALLGEGDDGRSD